MSDSFRIVFVNAEDETHTSRDSSRTIVKPGMYVLKLVSGKFYVGSTRHLTKRLNKHKYLIKLGLHDYHELNNSYKNGEVIDIYIHYTYTVDAARVLEQDLINKFKGSDLLLNKAYDVYKPGLGLKRSQTHIEKMKQAHIGKIVSKETRQKLSKAMSGKIVSTETKLLLRKINLGKKLTQETRDKMSKALKGRIVTPETCLNISKSKKGKGFPKAAINKSLEVNRKPVICFGVKYDSRAHAAKALGTSDVTINNRIKNPNFPDYKEIDHNETT